MKTAFLLPLLSLACATFVGCGPSNTSTPDKPEDKPAKLTPGGKSTMPPMPGAVPFKREAPPVPDAKELQKQIAAQAAAAAQDATAASSPESATGATPAKAAASSKKQ